MNLEKIYKKLKDINNIYNNDDIKEMLVEMQVELITNGKINKGVLSAFKSITKNNADRPIFEQIFQANNDNYIICNGYLLIDFTEDVNNVPNELRAYIDYKTTEYTKPSFTFENLKCKENNIKTAKINLEDMEKIIKYNKINKTKIPFVIDNKILFDTEYMQGILNIAKFKDKELNVVYYTETAPIEMIFENCKAILLPVKPRSEEKFNETIEKINEIIK